MRLVDGNYSRKKKGQGDCAGGQRPYTATFPTLFKGQLYIKVLRCVIYIKTFFNRGNKGIMHVCHLNKLQL